MSNSILDTLNENQRTAATTINEHVRIIAVLGKNACPNGTYCLFGQDLYCCKSYLGYHLQIKRQMK